MHFSLHHDNALKTAIATAITQRTNLKSVPRSQGLRGMRHRSNLQNIGNLCASFRPAKLLHLPHMQGDDGFFSVASCVSFQRVKCRLLLLLVNAATLTSLRLYSDQWMQLKIKANTFGQSSDQINEPALPPSPRTPISPYTAQSPLRSSLSPSKDITAEGARISSIFDQLFLDRRKGTATPDKIREGLRKLSVSEPSLVELFALLRGLGCDENGDVSSLAFARALTRDSLGANE